MKRQQIAFAFALAYLRVMIILLGSIVLEDFMVYSNVLHDAPRARNHDGVYGYQDSG
jgi:hypothetical protein